jgi:uncharacterized membrane protein YesL
MSYIGYNNFLVYFLLFSPIEHFMTRYEQYLTMDCRLAFSNNKDILMVLFVILGGGGLLASFFLDDHVNYSSDGILPLLVSCGG